MVASLNEERKPLREFKNVTEIRLSEYLADIISAKESLGLVTTHFVTTAVHKRLPPKTSITVEKGRTIIEFGGAYGEIPKPVTCQVWSSHFGPTLSCHVAEEVLR